ncbi:Dihydropteroate synthase [Chryseobacterium taklimakanense]|uniref:Dihydropteroate synthase n=1 Tax=Chryseobacterium taklimakanense TaxID=536441 RepID=A0A239XWW4_9FLAO|nr:dihydropteroate synthase [Chryseobacterium taklimakanense]SNV50880.1 Dihydropteroate synthase [Chryseobacterium taklimakanense]
MKPTESGLELPFFSMNCNGKLIDLSVPKIMGILNMTPDSFSDGGKFNDEKNALLQTEKMLADGAEIIDIGPQSTRPNAEFLSSDEEIARLGKIISTIKREFPESLLSVDTFWSETVKYAYNEGIDIVNDISAGQYDPKLFETVAGTGLPYILMHVNPTYKSMHEKIAYDDVTVAVNKFLLEKARELLKIGVKDIILDPGFGFGKTFEDQHKMIEETQFIGLGKFPVLIGISRKSFIYKPLGKGPLDINEETQKLHLKVLQQGAKILRVHDVAEAKKTLDLYVTSLF